MPVALEVARGDLLVGPDNGLLMPAADRLGGIVAAHVLENRALWRDESASHASTAATSSRRSRRNSRSGCQSRRPAQRWMPAPSCPSRFPIPSRMPGALDTSVLFVDAFGNGRLAGQPADLAALRGRLENGDRFGVRVGDGPAIAMPWQATFGDVPVGALLLYDDADYAGLAIGVGRDPRPNGSGWRRTSPSRSSPSEPMPSKPLIEIDGLTFRYRRATSPRCERCRSRIEAGEVLLVAGPSGCGKSTLLRAINGLVPHAYSGELTGTVRVAGRPTTETRLREIGRDRGHACSRTRGKQIVGTTVESELAFGPENLCDQAPDAIRTRIEEVIAGDTHRAPCRARDRAPLRG